VLDPKLDRENGRTRGVWQRQAHISEFYSEAAKRPNILRN